MLSFIDILTKSDKRTEDFEKKRIELERDEISNYLEENQKKFETMMSITPST